MDMEEIWRNALGELEVTITRPNFLTWFKNTFLIDYKKGVFTIGVPGNFHQNYLQKHYLKDIKKALENQIEEMVNDVRFKVAAQPQGHTPIIGSNKVIHNPVDNSTATKASRLAKSGQLLAGNPYLNSDYKFVDFVVGSNNQLAQAAALAVASKPGQLYNPLYIYGNSGLGKTHLMQAIGHAFLERYPEKIILYSSSETFINEYINAVESGHGKAKDFKDHYRNVDLLLIDDIQFLSNKEGTQEEFFHTFNHLHQNKKQVVLTSDRPPKDIRGLENRLKTRFEGGMVCDITVPNLETREAILRHKAKKQGVEIDDKVIHYIAANVDSSIRELEGAFIRVMATCEVTNQTATEDNVADILKGYIEEKRRIITPDLIIKEVHRYFKIPVEDLLGNKRNKEVVLPRQITMYLLRSEANMSYPEIGKTMSGKDHSTIIHGYNKIEANIAQNRQIKDDISFIKEKLYMAIK